MSTQDNPRLRKNNFDLIRLILAAMAFFLHTYLLSRFEQLAWIPKVLSGTGVVKSFFIISGFLIFMSYERSSSISSYFYKRIRRIYPAIIAITFITAFGLFFVSTKGFKEYFSLDWLKYVGANLIFLNFLHPTLPGVFETNYLPDVNGSIWTLKIEVMFYISIPIFVYIFKYLPRDWVLFVVYLFSVAYRKIFEMMAVRTGNSLYLELSYQLPGQLSYFLSGAYIYYHLTFFEKHIKYIATAALVILIVNQFIPLILLEPAALAVLICFLGLFLYVGDIGRFGDFSYGVFGLHFPIVQIFLQYGWFKDNLWLYVWIPFILSFIAGILLWHGVEKRFLLRGSHYVRK